MSLGYISWVFKVNECGLKVLIHDLNQTFQWIWHKGYLLTFGQIRWNKTWLKLWNIKGFTVTYYNLTLFNIPGYSTNDNIGNWLSSIWPNHSILTEHFAVQSASRWNWVHRQEFLLSKCFLPIWLKGGRTKNWEPSNLKLFSTLRNQKKLTLAALHVAKPVCSRWG